MLTGTTTLTPFQRNRTLGLLSIGHGVAHWYNGLLSVLYPVLTVSLGLSFSQVGLIDGSRGVMAVIISLGGGYLADSFGQRRLFLALALVSLGVAFGLLGFATTFAILLLWLTFAGIGNNLWHPFALPLLQTLFPNRKSLALAVHDAGANSFHSLAPIVGGILLTTLSWQLVTKIHVWPGIVMGGLIMLGVPSVTMPRRESAGRSGYRVAWQAGILRNRQFILTGAISVCLTMARLSLFTFLPLFLAFEVGLNSASLGVHIGAMTFAGALMAPLAGTLADRFGLRHVLTGLVLLATIFVIVISFSQAGPFLLFTIAVIGGALFSTRSLILVQVLAVTPDTMGGSSIGAVFSLNRLFGIISPIVAGITADRFGLRAVFYYIAALLLLGTFLVFQLPQGRRVTA